MLGDDASVKIDEYFRFRANQLVLRLQGEELVAVCASLKQIFAVDTL